jgi:hypothetical protein
MTRRRRWNASDRSRPMVSPPNLVVTVSRAARCVSRYVGLSGPKRLRARGKLVVVTATRARRSDVSPSRIRRPPPSRAPGGSLSCSTVVSAAMLSAAGSPSSTVIELFASLHGATRKVSHSCAIQPRKAPTPLGQGASRPWIVQSPAHPTAQEQRSVAASRARIGPRSAADNFRRSQHDWRSS